MDPVTVAKLWLVVKPFKRFKAWRTRRKMRSWHEEHGGPPDEILEEFNHQAEVPMANSAFLTQVVLAVLRHAMTAVAPLGVTVTDDWLLQTAALLVGVAGLAWSGVRKWQAAKA